MKKKVLIFIDWYLPGYRAGGPIRSVVNMIAHLRKDLEFSVVTTDTDYAGKEPYPDVRSDAWNVLADGTRVYYFSKEKLSAEAIRDLIDRTDFDVAYLNGIYSYYFTLIPLRYLKKKNAGIVVAARGMLSEGSLGVKSTKKKLFLAFAKMTGLFQNVLFHATTQSELEDIRKRLGDKVHVKVAGNLPPVNAPGMEFGKEKKEGELKLVNVARIAPEKNLLYALRVLAKVKGNLTFDFYGPIYNEAYWRECQAVIRTLPPNVSANYKGVLASDRVDDVLTGYHLMFMPTTGENFGHIILQSLSVGCPVIISDRTPWSEVGTRNAGWSIPLKNETAYVDTIEMCCRLRQEEYDILSVNARNYAANYAADPRLLEDNRSLFS